MFNDLHGYIFSNLVPDATTHLISRRPVLGLPSSTTLAAAISTDCLGRQALLDSSNVPTVMLPLADLLLILMQAREQKKTTWPVQLNGWTPPQPWLDGNINLEPSPIRSLCLPSRTRVARIRHHAGEPLPVLPGCVASVVLACRTA